MTTLNGFSLQVQKYVDLLDQREKAKLLLLQRQEELDSINQKLETLQAQKHGNLLDQDEIVKQWELEPINRKIAIAQDSEQDFLQAKKYANLLDQKEKDKQDFSLQAKKHANILDQNKATFLFDQENIVKKLIQLLIQELDSTKDRITKHVVGSFVYNPTLKSTTEILRSYTRQFHNQLESEIFDHIEKQIQKLESDENEYLLKIFTSDSRKRHDLTCKIYSEIREQKLIYQCALESQSLLEEEFELPISEYFELVKKSKTSKDLPNTIPFRIQQVSDFIKTLDTCQVLENDQLTFEIMIEPLYKNCDPNSVEQFLMKHCILDQCYEKHFETCLINILIMHTNLTFENCTRLETIVKIKDSLPNFVGDYSEIFDELNKCV